MLIRKSPAEHTVTGRQGLIGLGIGNQDPDFFFSLFWWKLVITRHQRLRVLAASWFVYENSFQEIKSTIWCLKVIPAQTFLVFQRCKWIICWCHSGWWCVVARIGGAPVDHCSCHLRHDTHSTFTLEVSTTECQSMAFQHSLFFFFFFYKDWLIWV